MQSENAIFWSRNPSLLHEVVERIRIRIAALLLGAISWGWAQLGVGVKKAYPQIMLATSSKLLKNLVVALTFSDIG